MRTTDNACDKLKEMKSVPLNPTREMWRAGRNAMIGNDNPFQVYVAMIDAAPPADEPVDLDNGLQASPTGSPGEYRIIAKKYVFPSFQAAVEAAQRGDLRDGDIFHIDDRKQG